MAKPYETFPQVAHFPRVDLNRLAMLTDTMVSTSCRSDLNRSAVVIGLVGTLGAGKTRFCQELARSFEIASDEVTSPTFTLLRSYDVPHVTCSHAVVPKSDVPNLEPNRPRRWHHLDLYRLIDEDELWEIGIEELWDEPHAWTVMEWADRFADQMPAETIWIEIRLPTDGASNAREISVHCQESQHANWWECITAQLKLAKNH